MNFTCLLVQNLYKDIGYEEENTLRKIRNFELRKYNIGKKYNDLVIVNGKRCVKGYYYDCGCSYPTRNVIFEDG